MPIYQRKDKYGKYYQFGSRGKKYYFGSCSKSKKRAYNKALRQGRAIKASQRGGTIILTEEDLINAILKLL